MHDAWKRLAASIDLRSRLEAGEVVSVSASAIKRTTRMEPRLVARQDTREQRAPVLKDATVLPVANGKYVIVRGDGYHTIDPPAEVRTWKVTPRLARIASLPWSTGPQSESQVLDMAMASGVLQEFLDEPELLLTIRGRLRTPRFAFTFPSALGPVDLRVDGVQVEVDAGLEGEFINLVEAKLGKRTNFHVRQLYYPVRMWTTRVPQRLVRPILATYSDRTLSLRLYAFDPLQDYGSLILVKSVDFVFGDDREVERFDEDASVEDVLSTTSVGTSPTGIAFPQADDMAKVIDIVDAVTAGSATPIELVKRYGFTLRQASYYPTAARYLGLVQRGRRGLELTEAGVRMSISSRPGRRALVIRQLARLPVFRDSLEFALANNGAIPAVEQVSDWIREASAAAGVPLARTTPDRRARTVASWVRWALSPDLEPGGQE